MDVMMLRFVLAAAMGVYVVVVLAGYLPLVVTGRVSRVPVLFMRVGRATTGLPLLVRLAALGRVLVSTSILIMSMLVAWPPAQIDRIDLLSSALWIGGIGLVVAATTFTWHLLHNHQEVR